MKFIPGQFIIAISLGTPFIKIIDCIEQDYIIEIQKEKQQVPSVYVDNLCRLLTPLELALL